MIRFGGRKGKGMMQSEYKEEMILKHINEIVWQETIKED